MCRPRRDVDAVLAVVLSVLATLHIPRDAGTVRPEEAGMAMVA